MKILAIYDNGGKTADRYTCVFDYAFTSQRKSYSALAMDDNPYHPQGIGMHVEAFMGRHLGKKVYDLKALPAPVQKCILSEFIGEKVKLLRRYKRKESVWYFKSGTYKIESVQRFLDNNDFCFEIKTGPEALDYALIYPDEAGIIW